MFDGWELNGNVFPGHEDHHLSLEQRSRALCSGSGDKSKFVSSQNAALVSFNIPTAGQGFRLRVTYHPNPDSEKNYHHDNKTLLTLPLQPATF